MNKWGKLLAVLVTGGLILVWWRLTTPGDADYVSQEWLDTYHAASHENSRKVEAERS